MISFDRDICNDLDAATSREWLETNGIGGFACGTISGASTRRYHSILTAAVDPPLGRLSILSKYEETLIVDGEEFELSTNRFPGAVQPDGYRFISSFALDPFPTWTYNAGGVELIKTIFMVHGSNAAVCEWSIRDAGTAAAISLEVRPLISFVDYHHLQHANAEFDTGYTEIENTVSVKPYADKPPLNIIHNADAVAASGHWYRNFEYAIERERGFDFYEDLFQPFVLKYDLATPAHAIASTDEGFLGDAAELRLSEIARRDELNAAAGAEDDNTKVLVQAADQFIVKRGDGHSIIAGYPWFSDWGRDTMIALSGLTLATNRPTIARDIIVEYSRHISQGMIPNRFPDESETADYNTVDATLWYFEAVRAYVESTGDLDLIKKSLYDKLVGIIDWHVRGTRYEIHVDTDGLLYAGEAGTQLTWMDAKIGSAVITPRIGKPVEIQALWYNALRIMSEYANRLKKPEDVRRFKALAELCDQSFNALFWNNAEQCLFDVVDKGERDASVRPNQIFAVSLANSMLNPERARKVVDKVAAELLTPVGLRSLSPRDKRYCPIYIGSPLARDSAYHQGTVWAWPIGGFIDAYRRIYPDREETVAEMLNGLTAHLNEAGVGQISEIFDADEPHRPRGCFAQAWSVAELLRVLK